MQGIGEQLFIEHRYQASHPAVFFAFGPIGQVIHRNGGAVAFRCAAQ